MIYNTKKQREKSLKYYYKNREKRILYQREYDKTHKEKKRLQDKKRYKTKHYNQIQTIDIIAKKTIIQF